MRATALALVILLTPNGISFAAPFTCDFDSPSASSQNAFSCKVETTTDPTKEVTKCRKDYSATLFGQCDGVQPGGVDQLVCFFANPATPPNPSAKYLIEQPGVYVVAREWTGTIPPSSASIVVEYKDGTISSRVSCTADPLPINEQKK